MKITQQKLFISQTVEMMEVFSGFESKNKYRIMDENGQDIFFAYEKSGFLARQVLDTRRPLELIIMDKDAVKLKISRKFFIIKPKYKISTADGKIIGYFEKKSAVSVFKFNIFDENRDKKYTCNSSLKHPWTFRILKDEEEVGVIQKKWSGGAKEMFTDADNFVLDFGELSDQKDKALLLGAVFAIDLTKFEEGKD